MDQWIKPAESLTKSVIHMMIHLIHLNETLHNKINGFRMTQCRKAQNRKAKMVRLHSGCPPYIPLQFLY